MHLCAFSFYLTMLDVFFPKKKKKKNLKKKKREKKGFCQLNLSPSCLVTYKGYLPLEEGRYNAKLSGK